MSTARRHRVKELLSQAARLPAQERRGFVEEAAGDDRIVAAEVTELLDALGDGDLMAAPTLLDSQRESPSGPAAFASFEKPGDRIGRYRLLQQIGEGGFGTVFMAEQTEPVVRRVALKIIKAGMDTRQVIARFEAERQALALMDHPSIARVLDAGETVSGRPYFVMELVRGEPVTQYCDREKLSIRQRLELFRDVCGAVQHAHQKGIIHRDIKPSNVLVTVADPGAPGLPKVIDFGIAKATQARLTDKTLFTEMHQIIGTPEYMSPEQADTASADIDTRSDVYSLGVLLYELLTGTTPFDARELAAAGLQGLIRTIREVEPPRPSNRVKSLLGSSIAARPFTPPSARNRDSSAAVQIAERRHLTPPFLLGALRGDLDWIVMKCLEKERRRRYATASALADDIQRYLGHHPVQARPPSAGYFLRKFARRNRALVAGAAVIGVSLALGLTGTLAGLRWALRERDRAEQEQDIARRSAQEARAQASRADQKASEAEAVTSFMREVLTSVQPQNDGSDVRLIDVLSRASAAAPQRFAGHPLQEAEVRGLLAETYESLSRWPAAMDEWFRANALLRSELDADHPRALRSEVRWAICALASLDIAAAERVLPSLIERVIRVLGPDDRTTLDAHRALANLHLSRGRLDASEQLLLELRSHPKLSEDQSQFLIVGTLFEISRRRSGDADESELAAMQTTTRKLALECVARATAAYGPDSPQALHSQLRLAYAEYDLGDSAAAAQISRAVLDASLPRLDPCHSVRSQALRVLATALSRMGDDQTPADLFLEHLRCVRSRIRGETADFLGVLHDAVPMMVAARRAVEGEALARELLAALARFGGGHDDMVADMEAHLAQCLSLQGRVGEAEAIFDRLLQLEALAFVQARIHLFYASHLVRAGQFEDAERELIVTVQNIRSLRRGTSSTRPYDVIDEFISLYQAWGRPEKAAEYEALRAEVIAAAAQPRAETGGAP